MIKNILSHKKNLCLSPIQDETDSAKSQFISGITYQTQVYEDCSDPDWDEVRFIKSIADKYK